MYVAPDQQDRRIIVTGSNSGTGREAARRLAAAGAEVVLAVRTPSKGEEARQSILAETPDARVEVRRLDLADLASVTEFADGVVADGRPLQALVNNAGVMAPPRRMTTSDGFELQLGSNYLGPFALTMRLLPTLLETPGARVVTMSSGMANFGRIGLDDLAYERRRYRAFPAYSQSKLADLIFTVHLARIATDRGWDLLSLAAHPGFTHTNLQTAGASLGQSGTREPFYLRLGFVPSQEVEQGAEPLLYAVADTAVTQGGYYGPTGRFDLVGPTGPARIPRRATDQRVAAKLWAASERLTGTSLPAAASVA